MPNVITFADGNSITYDYDANGSKLSVAYKIGGNIAKTEYVGNKVYKNGTLSMILTEEGYITLSGAASTYHYFLKDHQGNNRVVINQSGTVEQVNHYYPFGGLFGEGLQGSNQPYKYNGKEFDNLLGLNMYDYGARHYDPYSGGWINVDPMAEKYYSISPYVYVVNNPVRFIDPTGMEVETDELSRSNISNTLTKQEAKYVRFDKNGVLNTKRLNKSKSTSKNMIALKSLANSEVVYSFQVADKDHADNAYYDNSATGGNFYRGTTEMPNAESNPSPDNKVYVLVGKILNEKQQVMTTAHEGFGHAYFYEIYRNVEKASHTYKSEGRMIWDEELQMNVFESTKVPTNITLENQIKTVVKQAENNYNERKKK